MDTPVTNQVQGLIKSRENEVDSKEMTRLKEALKEFDSLVQKGIIQKRGYTLMSIEELYNLSPEKIYNANNSVRFT